MSKLGSIFLKIHIVGEDLWNDTFHLLILATWIYWSGSSPFTPRSSTLTRFCFLFQVLLILSPTSLSSGPTSFFFFCASVMSFALSPSLYLDLFNSLSDFVCVPKSHIHTDSLFFLSFFSSLSISLPLHPPTGLHWRNAITFPISGPPSGSTHSCSPPPKLPQLSTPLIIPLICTGVLWQFIFPHGTSERSALLVYSWLCFERSAKLAVPLPEQIHESTQMWEAHIFVLASCAVV